MKQRQAAADVGVDVRFAMLHFIGGHGAPVKDTAKDDIHGDAISAGGKIHW